MIAQAIRHEIESGSWSSDRSLPSELELSRRFDVALMTVRHAIANLVDDGILRRIHGKGTFIVDAAPAEPTKRTRHPIGLLIPGELRHSDSYYFPDVLKGFRQVMAENGHQFAIFDDIPAPDGTVLAPGSALACLLLAPEHTAYMDDLLEQGYRLLAINHYRGTQPIPCARVDDTGGVEQAVDYLISLGHEHLGFIVGHPNNLDAIDRLAGFRNAVRKHKLTRCIEVGYNFSEEAGYRAAKEMLLNADRPTAILCASDLSAAGALKAAADLGIVMPDDLSVVGFGDFSVAPYLTPTLTTLRQPRTSLGRAAAESLIQLANDKPATSHVLRTELIVRGSTARCSTI